MSPVQPLRVVAERYRLLEQLGQGGMGRVWLARDDLLHRHVAIKEIVPPTGLTPGERQEMRERTLREARAIARLTHPNVVRIFDVLGSDGDPWIVMEYVRGRSLQQVLATDGPLPVPRVVDIGLGVLAALRAAHRAGVLHRDVKPGNVLLGDDGRVVLTDFGLATVPGDPVVTRTGLVLGSPAYLAPERARDGSAGPEADMWSLGATLFAAVEGQSPYARPTAIATLAALATEPPAPAKQAGPLRPLLNGLLRKNPADRITPAEAERLLLRAAGRRSRMESGRAPYPVVRLRRPPGPDTFAAAAGAALGGLRKDPGVPGKPTPVTGASGTGRVGPAEAPAPGPMATGTASPSARPASPSAGPAPRMPGATATSARPAAAGAEEAGESIEAQGLDAGMPPPAQTRTADAQVAQAGTADAPAAQAGIADGGAANGSVGPTWTPDLRTQDGDVQDLESQDAGAGDETGKAAAGGTEPAGTPETEHADRNPPLALSAADGGDGPLPADTVVPIVPGPRMPAHAVIGAAAVPEPPPARPRRRAWLWVAAAIGVVVTLVLAVAALTANRESQGERGNSGATPRADSGGGAAAATGAAQHPSTAGTTPRSAGNGAGLPQGWRLYRDRTGFAVAVPVGWKMSRRGSMVYFREPGGGRVLGIDQTNRPKPDPVKDWRRQEANRVAAGDWDDYRRVRIVAVDYFVKAADWEFTYRARSGRMHVVNRGFITSPHQAYAIYWSTPESQWSANLDDFRLIAQSFRPRG